MVIEESELTELQEVFQKISFSEEYFVKVNYKKKIDYSKDNYWKSAIDPDGNLRSIINEFSKQKEEISYITEYLKDLNYETILDIGCGQGAFLSSLNKRKKKFGVEPSKIASQKAKSHGEIICGEYSKDLYQKDFFDVIYTHHVIEHVKNPIKFLENIKYHLKKNGLLIIGTPDFDSACARLFKDKYRLLSNAHISLFSNESMQRFLRDNSFKIIKSEYPFFDTEYFNKKNLRRLFNKENISPPFYGNYMTFFARHNNEKS